MEQPTREAITEKINMVLDGRITRESVNKWAREYIDNDEKIKVEDLEAWHYLVDVSMIDLLVAPNEYLYNEEDIRTIIEGYI